MTGESETPTTPPTTEGEAPGSSASGVALAIFFVLLLGGAVAAMLLIRPGVPTDNRARGNGPTVPPQTDGAQAVDLSNVDDVGTLIPPGQEDPAVRFGPRTEFVPDGLQPTAAELAQIDALAERFIELWESGESVATDDVFHLERMLWEVACQGPEEARKRFRLNWHKTRPDQNHMTVAAVFAQKLGATLAYDRRRQAGWLRPQTITRYRTEPVPGRPELVTWWRVVPATRPVRRFALWLIREDGDDGRPGPWRVYDVMDEGHFIRVSALSPLVQLAFVFDMERVNEVFAKHQQVEQVMARIAAGRIEVPLARIDALRADPDLYAWRPALDVQRLKVLIRLDKPADEIVAEGERLLAADDASPLLHVWLGNFHFRREEYEAAARHLEAYRTTVDDSDRVNAVLGQCRSHLGDTDRAVAVWRAWASVAPRAGHCHLLLVAHHRTVTKDTARAVQLLRQLLLDDRVNPSRVRDEIDAMIDGLAGPDGATRIRDMIASLPAEARPPDALLYLARAHAALGEVDEAANVFAFQLADDAASDGTRRAAWLDRLDLELARGDAEAALAWLDAHAGLARNEADHHLLRAAVLASQQRFDDALPELQAAHERDAGSVRWLTADTQRHAVGTRALWNHGVTGGLLQQWHEEDTGAAYDLPPARDDLDWRRRTR